MFLLTGRPVPFNWLNVRVTDRTFNFNVKPYFDKGKTYGWLSKGTETKIHLWGVKNKTPIKTPTNIGNQNPKLRLDSL